MNKRVLGGVVFVVALLVLNGLSYALDWPFWIY